MKLNHKKIVHNFLILLCLCLFATLGCGFFKSESEKLREEITDVNKENEKLRKELSALRSENSSMHTRLAELDQQIATLQKEIKNMQKDLNSFKVRVKGADKRNKKSLAGP